MSQNLEIRKLPLIQKLIALQDEQTFLIIEQLLNIQNESDWATDLSDAQKRSVERGIEDIKNERMISFEDLKTKLHKGQ